MPESFTEREGHALSRSLDAGEAAMCPRCAVPLDRRAVTPRRDVSYVRDRLWLTCPVCHRTIVLDRRENR